MARLIRPAIVTIASALLLTSTLMAQAPDRRALAALDDEITRAYAELITSNPATREAIDSRISVLRVTRAYLELLAAANGRLTFTVDGRPYNGAAAKRQIPLLEQELKRLDAAIVVSDRASRREGPEGELARITAATQRHTRALVHQRLLAARFGIPPYVTLEFPSPPPPPPSVESPQPLSSARFGELRDLEPSPLALRVGASSYEIVSTTPSFVRIAWETFVQNYESEGVVEFDLVIEYRDRNGYVLEDDTLHRESIEPLGGRAFSGYSFIDTTMAQRVAEVVIRTDQLRYQ